ncbi:MAG: hypothetical protein IJX78_07510 [Bacilli bacterium]|nr:hypothetical protein [Bacilli bacterium]
MKKSRLKIIVFIGSLVLFFNFVISLTRYLDGKEKAQLIRFICYGLTFVLWVIWFKMLTKEDGKYYAIGFNNVYYYYGQNILDDSKNIAEEELKDKALLKISSVKKIEYRLIDNEYVTQKIGLVKLDKIKTLIIFEKANYKTDYKNSLYDVLVEDHKMNVESFINMKKIPDLDEENVIYADRKLDAVVIRKVDECYKTIYYVYSIFPPIKNLDEALTKCVPHWFINKEYPVNTYDDLTQAKEEVLEVIDLINDERLD